MIRCIRSSIMHDTATTRIPLGLLVQASQKSKQTGKDETVKHQPKVRVRHKDAPLAKPPIDRVLKGAVISFNGTLHSRQKIHKAEHTKNEQCRNHPHPILPGVHAAEPKDGKTKEHDNGAEVHELHRTVVLTTHAIFLPIAIVILDGSAKEEVPAWEHGLHLTIFLSSSVAAVVSVHLLIATHLIMAFEVPPAAQIVVAAVPIIIIIAVSISIIIIIVSIGLVFVLLLLLFILVVLAIVAMVSIAFRGPLAHGDDHGEGRGEEPS
mmetsp:Transcript_11598/g.21435  ORF Transcript_11598/g.21435 Transcript_11598/m.21435 type:complete len:265 (-) Transcript_11598:338-1132(-)